MLQRHVRYAIVVLLVSLVMLATVPAANTEIEIRSELRAGDLLFNDEVISIPFGELTTFHRDTATSTDTEAFAMAPLSPGTGDGFTLAQAGTSTVAATQTGFFQAIIPNYVLLETPAPNIGESPEWAGKVSPLRIAGLPVNTAMIFPDMTKVTRVENDTGCGGNFSYQNNTLCGGNNVSHIIDSNNSRPYYPGNMMVVRNVTDENGRNRIVLNPAPRDYMVLAATPEYRANRTIMERMWRNVHLNFFMDRAYSGETCFPDLICTVRNPFALMYFEPMNLSISGALTMTQSGRHIEKLFWEV